MLNQITVVFYSYIDNNSSKNFKESIELEKIIYIFPVDWVNTNFNGKHINTALLKLSGKKLENFYVGSHSNKAIDYKIWHMAYTLFILTL